MLALVVAGLAAAVGSAVVVSKTLSSAAAKVATQALKNAMGQTDSVPLAPEPVLPGWTSEAQWAPYFEKPWHTPSKAGAKTYAEYSGGRDTTSGPMFMNTRYMYAMYYKSYVPPHLKNTAPHMSGGGAASIGRTVVNTVVGAAKQAVLKAIIPV